MFWLRVRPAACGIVCALRDSQYADRLLEPWWLWARFALVLSIRYWQLATQSEGSVLTHTDDGSRCADEPDRETLYT